MKPRCFAADLPGAGPCDGRLVRAHLIPQSMLKREWSASKMGRGTSVGNGLAAQRWRKQEMLVWDPRAWVWMCGGISGAAGHHGQLDFAKTLRIPRHRIPAGTEEMAVELGFGWWLDRTYGERTEMDGAREFPAGRSEAAAFTSRAESLAVTAAFLEEYENDMHLEARGEPFAFASREKAAEALLERLGLT